MDILVAIGFILAGIAILLVGYMYEVKLRTEYHESLPTALMISGGIVIVLGFLFYMQTQYFKKGNYLGFMGARFLTDLIFTGAR